MGLDQHLARLVDTTRANVTMDGVEQKRAAFLLEEVAYWRNDHVTHELLTYIARPDPEEIQEYAVEIVNNRMAEVTDLMGEWVRVLEACINDPYRTNAPIIRIVEHALNSWGYYDLGMMQDELRRSVAVLKPLLDTYDRFFYQADW